MSSHALVPRSGWPAFDSSHEVTDFLWDRCRDWHYLNLTSNTSMWESSASAGYVYVEYEEDRVVELLVKIGEGTHALEVISELKSRFGLQPTNDSDDLG